jgi:hypothetical protein
MSKKIPDRPDFLKNDEDTNNPPKFPLPPEPPPMPSNNLSDVHPTPEAAAETSKPDTPTKATTPVASPRKRRFLFAKRKGKIPLIVFRNNEVSDAPSDATDTWPEREETLNDYFPPLVGQILAVLLVIASAGALFFYYQAEGYKNKFQAMDSRILSFTKEIASLNQENNSLSGKIVNYQKELEGRSDTRVAQLEQQVTDLQNQVATYQTAPAGSTAVAAPTTAAPKATTTLEAADPLPPTQGAVAPTTPPNVVRTAPPVAVPKASPGGRSIPKATNPSVNYEANLRTKGELACLQYYKSENLKKCKGRDNKYTTVIIRSKATPTGSKLTYQCQGPGTKPLNFKYGPMEIYNNCAGR